MADEEQRSDFGDEPAEGSQPVRPAASMPRGDLHRLTALLAEGSFQTADERRELLASAGLDAVASSIDLQGAPLEVARRVIHGLEDHDLGAVVHRLADSRLDPESAEFVSRLLDRYDFGPPPAGGPEAEGSVPVMKVDVRGGRAAAGRSRRRQLLSCSVAITLGLAVVVLGDRLVRMAPDAHQAGPAEVFTDAKDCRWIGDTELDTGDWTRVSLAYEILPTADRREVELLLRWSVQELRGDRSPGDTRFETDKRIVLWPDEPLCEGAEITRLGDVEARGSWEEDWHGELHGFQKVPDTGSLREIEVRFDGPGRNDYLLQGLRATVAPFRVVTTPCDS